MCIPWFKLNQDFFKDRLSQKMLLQDNGHEMMCSYLQMLILSGKNDGQIHVDIEELPISEHLAIVLDTRSEVIDKLLLFLNINHAIKHVNEACIEMTLYKDCLKSGSESLHRVRKHRTIKQKKHCNVTETLRNVTSTDCNVTNEANTVNTELNAYSPISEDNNKYSTSECNVTETLRNVTSTDCNVTNEANTANTELDAYSPISKDNKYSTPECNVTETLHSSIQPIIEVIYETPDEEKGK